MNNSTATTTQQILFIDSQVQDLDELLAGVQANTAVYVLHPQENGIAQITTILQQHPKSETVYLVAHGQPGCLYLGNTIFNQETLPTVSELLKHWNIGQLLIYACNVASGETGEAFLQSLHHYTKAKIAASSHPIGQTEFGQNWQLNQTTHPIEIKSVFNPEVMASYSGVLAAGDLDTSFGGDGIVTTDLGSYYDSGKSMVLQPDGKIVMADDTGYPNYDIAVLRYNSNGSLDTTFSGDGKLTTDLGGEDSGKSMVLQPDGKIVVAGGIFDFAVARLNSNGSLDTTFSDDGIVTTDLGDEFEWSSDLALQPDGKIVLAGNSGDASGYHPANIAMVRYNSNGSLDTTFSGDGKLTTDLGSLYDFANSVVVQPDGKIVVAGDSDSNFALVRYNSNGSLDTTLSSNGQLITDLGSYEHGNSIALQPDGKIVVGGSSGNDFAVVRYLNDTASGTINGTANNDILTGSANPETINGLGGNDKLLGNGGNDSLNGGDGVDTLDGGAGSDQLKGGTGNDTYVVDNVGDIVTELASGGTDLIQSSVTYTLPVEVENLTLTGTTAINGTGNGLANKINGNSAANILKGAIGNDLLVGNGGADQLLGGHGNDSFNGGAGNDTLTGGLGADKFIYNTNAAFTISAVGVDSITDFIMAQGDKIVLDKTTFPKISSVAGTGFSINSEFAKVTTDTLAANSAADIVYNTATGGLFYNQNGTAAGFGTGGQFLTLTSKPALTATQFVIQA